jgi:SAM-dependent methyltransferase
MNANPSADSVAALKAASQEVLTQQPSEGLKKYQFYHLNRLALDYEWLCRSHSSNSKTLEIGGYPFFLTLALKHRGFQITTVDKPTDISSKLSSALGLEVVGCDIEKDKLPFPDNSFDVILLNEVFEHLRIDLIFTMNEVHRVLKPGGKLWLSTPNLKSLKGIINFHVKSEAWSVVGEGLYAQYKSLHEQGFMGHVREYTSKEVSGFLANVGFKPGKVIYRGRYNNAPARWVAGAFPSLKPYFSVVASK